MRLGSLLVGSTAATLSGSGIIGMVAALFASLLISFLLWEVRSHGRDARELGGQESQGAALQGAACSGYGDGGSSSG